MITVKTQITCRIFQLSTVSINQQQKGMSTGQTGGHQQNHRTADIKSDVRISKADGRYEERSIQIGIPGGTILC